MGEISKRTGELGEEAGFRFLERIGWNNGQRGLSIPCNDSTKHAGRQTHGVDYLKIYECPLIQQRLVNAVVSIKATKNAYHKYPNSDFKKFLSELSDICNCFYRSNERFEALEQFQHSNYETTSIIGVLLWFSNDPDEESRDLLEEVSNANIENLGDFQFEASYIVDLRRAEFLWKILKHADSNYVGWEFLYIETGLNYREDIKVKSGPTLPVEYINASIIPLKQFARGAENLILYTIEPYSEDTLKKLTGLANKLSGTFAGSIEILFSEFNFNDNENHVRKVMEYFRDDNLAEKVKVSSYNDKLIR